MRAPTVRFLGVDVWGFGTTLYGKSAAPNQVFGHDGENYQPISHAVRVEPRHAQQNRVVRQGWIRYTARLPQLLSAIALGTGAIVVLLAAWVMWHVRSRRHTRCGSASCSATSGRDRKYFEPGFGIKEAGP